MANIIYGDIMLELKNICKSYNKDGNHQVALKNINLKLSSKGIVSIVGKSGSGKTTLLNIIGSLDNSDFGELIVDGKNIREFSDNELDSYRNKYVSFIFQNYTEVSTLLLILRVTYMTAASITKRRRVPVRNAKFSIWSSTKHTI